MNDSTTRRGVLPIGLALTLAVLPAALAPSVGASAWTQLSATLAWLGSGMIATSLLLMVREPGFAAWFGGLERMYHWHHGLGTTGYVLILGHPLALAAQALPQGGGAPWAMLQAASAHAVGISGWIALIGLMVGLATTFALRLPYRLWRSLHGVLGAAVLAGVAHALMARGLIASTVLLAVPAAIGLGWRIVRADRGGSARPFEVAAVAQPAEQMTEVTLRPLAQPLPVRPGQFVMVAFFEGPRYRGCGEFHPFTVSGIDAQGVLRVTIKALGECTRHVQTLEARVAARVQGPFGSFLQDRPAGPELWVAGGIGIAPFIALLRAGPVERDTVLVYAAREREGHAFADELAALSQRESRLALHLITSNDDPERIFQALARTRDLAQRHVYMCGPPPLIELVSTWLREHAVAPEKIHTERFDFR